MRAVIECFPCYLRQAIHALERAGLDEDAQREALCGIMKLIPELAHDRSPAETSSHVLHRAVEFAGVQDPFREAKEESNRLALGFVPRLRELVARSDDPLLTALKVAVAGNVIDLGIFESYDLEGSLSEVMRLDFARSDYNAFVRKLEERSHASVRAVSCYSKGFSKGDFTLQQGRSPVM